MISIKNMKIPDHRSLKNIDGKMNKSGRFIVLIGFRYDWLMLF